MLAMCWLVFNIAYWRLNNDFYSFIGYLRWNLFVARIELAEVEKR